jgi:hypothetical protein
VVAAGIGVLVSLPGLIAAWPVRVEPVPVDRLYGRIAASADQPYQGFVLSTGTAGLPSLPQLADSIALLNGETRLRVWYAAPDSWRVDQIGPGTEQGLYQAPTDQLLWDFGTNQITTIVGVVPLRLPRGADLVPPDLARRILAIAGSRGLHPLPARRVAGISAVGLRIAPDDPRTTVGYVDIWADPGTGLPLQVEITGRGASAPILVTRFLDITLTAPASTILQPPAGGAGTGYVFTAGTDIARAFRSLRPGSLPLRLGGFSRTDDVASSVGLGVYGTGLSRFLVISVPRRVGFDAYDRATAAGGTKVTLPGGEGVIVSTSLITVMAMDSDPARRTYLLVGLVDPTVLRQAGSDLSRSTEAP